MYCIVPQIVKALSPRSRRRDRPKSVKQRWPKWDSINISIPQFPLPKAKWVLHSWDGHLKTIQRHKRYIYSIWFLVLVYVIIMQICGFCVCFLFLKYDMNYCRPIRKLFGKLWDKFGNDYFKKELHIFKYRWIITIYQGWILIASIFVYI